MVVDDDLTAALTALRAVGRRSSVARGLQGDVEHRAPAIHRGCHRQPLRRRGILDRPVRDRSGSARVPRRGGRSGRRGGRPVVKTTEGIAGLRLLDRPGACRCATSPRTRASTSRRPSAPATSHARSRPFRSSTTRTRSACSRCWTSAGSPSFSLRDMELLAIFARQADDRHHRHARPARLRPPAARDPAPDRRRATVR